MWKQFCLWLVLLRHLLLLNQSSKMAATDNIACGWSVLSFHHSLGAEKQSEENKLSEK